MFKKNKKATAISLLIIIIILLATLITLWTFYNKLFKQVGNTDKEICKSSVYAHFLTKVKGKNIFNTKIDCKTQLINIEKKDNEKSKYIISNAMYDCWDQFGEGKLNLFEDENIYCFVCHHIDFKDKNLIIDDFPEFLATRRIPKGKKTYLQYLTGYKTENSQILGIKDFENIPKERIDTSKSNDYAVVFTYIKGKEKIEKFFDQTKKIGGGTVAGVGGVLIITGVVSTGVGAVIIGGGVLALLSGYFGEADLEWASFIVLRPYNEDMIVNELGCEYAPISHT